MLIETDRLYLVPVSENHIKEINRYFDDQVNKYMYPSVAKNINETKEVVHQFIQQRKDNTDYVYAITRKETNEFIGLAGIHHCSNSVPELGIWTKSQSHGNHFGREAIGGLIEIAANLGKQKARYPVDKRNIPSKKLPLFYGGRRIERDQKVITPDGRTLMIETYEIETKTIGKISSSLSSISPGHFTGE